MTDTFKLIARLRAEAEEARETGAHDYADLFTRTADALADLSGWQPALTAPRDAIALAVICRLRCCHPGGLIVTVASRVGGEWVANIEHAVGFEMWRPMPEIPSILRNKGGVQ